MHDFYVPIFKSVEIADDGWTFEGIASTSGVDLVGDVIYPDSFEKSLETFKSFGRIFYNHNYAKAEGTLPMEAQTPIGRILDARIIPGQGLYIKGLLNKQHSLSQKIWKEIFSNPDPAFKDSIGLSIGAKPLGPVRKSFSKEHGRWVNILPELILYEVSLTTTPVNTETRTWGSVIKSWDSCRETDELGEIMATEVISTSPTGFNYNKETGHFLVKSVITDAQGKKQEIEQYISKAVFLKAFGKDEEKDKPEDGEDTPPAGMDKPADAAPPTPPAADPAAGGLPGATPPAPEADPGAAPGDPAAAPMPGEDPAAAGGLPGGDPAGAPPMPGGDPAAGGMPGGDPAAPVPGDPAGLPGQDAATQDTAATQALMLDKLDIIIDHLAENAQNDSVEAQNAGVGTSDTPPDAPMLKSLQEFEARILKSIEEKFAVLFAAAGTSGVQKSVTVVQPSVVISADSEGKPVLKSFGGQELDVTVLKGYIADYRGVKDPGSAGSQQRAKVKLQVGQEFGLSDAEFLYYVKTIK